MPISFAGARREFRSVVTGQSRCPGGEVLEVPAAFGMECNYLLATAYTMIIGVLAKLMLEFARNIVFRFNNANSVMF